MHKGIPAIIGQFRVCQQMEIADVAKYNWQVLRLLDDIVDDLAVHGSEPYGLGNGPLGGVKVEVYRATPLVMRKSSILPLKELAESLEPPICVTP